jgi:hypothetical protein
MILQDKLECLSQANIFSLAFYLQVGLIAYKLGATQRVALNIYVARLICLPRWSNLAYLPGALATI